MPDAPKLPDAARLDELERWAHDAADAAGQLVTTAAQELRWIAVARYALQLRALIEARNAAQVAECDGIRASDDQGAICWRYRHRDRGCPNCPRLDMIDLPAGLAQGEVT